MSEIGGEAYDQQNPPDTGRTSYDRNDADTGTDPRIIHEVDEEDVDLGYGRRAPDRTVIGSETYDHVFGGPEDSAGSSEATHIRPNGSAQDVDDKTGDGTGPHFGDASEDDEVIAEETTATRQAEGAYDTNTNEANDTPGAEEEWDTGSQGAREDESREERQYRRAAHEGPFFSGPGTYYSRVRSEYRENVRAQREEEIDEDALTLTRAEAIAAGIASTVKAVFSVAEALLATPEDKRLWHEMSAAEQSALMRHVKDIAAEKQSASTPPKEAAASTAPEKPTEKQPELAANDIQAPAVQEMAAAQTPAPETSAAQDSPAETPPPPDEAGTAETPDPRLYEQATAPEDATESLLPPDGTSASDATMAGGADSMPAAGTRPDIGQDTTLGAASAEAVDDTQAAQGYTGPTTAGPILEGELLDHSGRPVGDTTAAPGDTTAGRAKQANEYTETLARSMEGEAARILTETFGVGAQATDRPASDTRSGETAATSDTTSSRPDPAATATSSAAPVSSNRTEEPAATTPPVSSAQTPAPASTAPTPAGGPSPAPADPNSSTAQPASGTPQADPSATGAANTAPNQAAAPNTDPASSTDPNAAAPATPAASPVGANPAVTPNADPSPSGSEPAPQAVSQNQTNQAAPNAATAPSTPAAPNADPNQAAAPNTDPASSTDPNAAAPATPAATGNTPQNPKPAATQPSTGNTQPDPNQHDQQPSTGRASVKQPDSPSTQERQAAGMQTMRLPGGTNISPSLARRYAKAKAESRATRLRRAAGSAALFGGQLLAAGALTGVQGSGNAAKGLFQKIEARPAEVRARGLVRLLQKTGAVRREFVVRAINGDGRSATITVKARGRQTAEAAARARRAVEGRWHIVNRARVARRI
ncbi:MAG TPA: hypothetical protein VFT16_03645 [Candidatus Saccharimonadales bacterium]|nr:hypothetical protein [Candidatus Saccharimonadales bacterium]